MCSSDLSEKGRHDENTLLSGTIAAGQSKVIRDTVVESEQAPFTAAPEIAGSVVRGYRLRPCRKLPAVCESVVRGLSSSVFGQAQESFRRQFFGAGGRLNAEIAAFVKQTGHCF